MIRAFSNLNIGHKIMALFLFLGLGFIICEFYSFWTLQLLAVNGPRYKRIVEGKDLVADILPPPEYLVESYLVVLQLLVEKDIKYRDTLIEKCKQLRTDYETRHDFWEKQLEDSEIKRIIVTEANRPGMEFLRIRDSEFIPAILTGNFVLATSIANGRLKEQYELHRAAVDRLVELTNQRNVADERSIAQEIKTLITLMVVMGIMVLLVCGSLSFLLIRSITVRMRQMISVACHIAKGDLSMAEQVMNDFSC